jgi:hypothetical protein
MVARRYATTHPERIAGLVSIDPEKEDFVAAYKELLTPEQYAASVERLGRGQRRPDGQAQRIRRSAGA